MLKKLIIKARQKPKAARERIAFTIAGIFTGLVFVVWAYHLPARNAALLEDRNLSEDNSVFSGFLTEIKDQVTTVKEAVNEIATSTESAAEATSTQEAVIEPLILDQDNIDQLNQKIQADDYRPTDSASSTTVSPATSSQTVRIQTIPTATTSAPSTQ